MADARIGPDTAQLVAKYHRDVYRYAYRLCGSVQDAEDLTQQTFLAAHRKLEQLRKIDNARAWLFAILRNCFLKDRQRRRPALADEAFLDEEAVATLPHEEDVDRDGLQRALDRLSDTARLVVMMFYFEECTYREIADRLAIPIGTVMSRLARAKGQLRSILFEPEDDQLKPATPVAVRRG